MEEKTPGNEGDVGSIEHLEESLYSRDKKQLERRERRAIHERDFGVEEGWATEEEIEQEEKMKKRGKPLMHIILLGSLGFFAVSVVVSLVIIFVKPTVSPDNVIVRVDGPAIISGGDELNLIVSVQNINPVEIEGAVLVIKYPDGTRAAGNLEDELINYSDPIGTVDVGEETKVTAKAALFGEENTNKQILVSVEYRTKGSSALIETKPVVYEVVLASSPLSLAVESLDEAISGQEVEFVATVKSNSKDIVEGAMLTVDYPFGFEFIESTPDPTFRDGTWHLGDIPSEGEVEVRFKGTLSGQEGDDRVFRFRTGLERSGDKNQIGAVFVDVQEVLAIKRPFLTVDLEVGGGPKPFVVHSGGSGFGTINFTNNLPTQVFDGEIEAVITGSVLDRSSVIARGGFFKSSENTLVWTRGTTPDLGVITAGDGGSVDFSFDTFGASSGERFRNPIIDIDVTVRGKRLSEDNVPEEIISTISKQIKVESDLALTAKILRNSGPFTNTGPIPPRAEQQTTYTIVLSVFNSSNDVENVQLVTTLPQYVEWTGNISPTTEDLKITPVGSQIVWSLGTVKAGTGTTLPLREVAFQIRVEPSITQIGDAIVLVNEQSIVGQDTFTKTELADKKQKMFSYINEQGFGELDATVAP